MYTGKITQTKKNFTRTESGKSWKSKPDCIESREITEHEHESATIDSTLKFFRALGGSETAERTYTAAGYKVTRLTSTSPDRQHKTVREYTFNY